MVLMDALSRLPSRDQTNAIPLHHPIYHIAFSDKCLKMFNAATQQDPVLTKVYEHTYQGWSDTHRQIPHIARRYLDMTDELHLDEGLLIKGK